LGAYGGPGGESYEYLDLPPSKPKNLFIIFPGDKVILAWGANTESDISHYDIYRDRVSGFIPGDENRIDSSASPVYYDLDIQIGPSYFYQVTAWDRTGHQSEPSEEIVVATTGVEDTASDNETIPASFSLLQNYPNPFNPVTKIKFSVPLWRGEGGRIVTLKIFDILGREIQTLVNDKLNPGTYEVTFDGSNYASGVYFYQLRAGDFTQINKMILLK